MGTPTLNRRPSHDVVADLIETKRALIPLDEKYEGLKEEIRAYGAHGYITDDGVVTVSEPEVRTFKATVPVLDADKFVALKTKEKAALIAAGIVVWEDVYTRNAKAKVETVPN